MANSQHYVLLLSALTVVAAYWGPDLPPGPYCGSNNECCISRQDSCSHRILGTLCYCDQFCNHTALHDDCCPDYVEVCLGVVSTPPPGPITEPCRHGGQLYLPGSTRMDDCNSCECIDEGGSARWVCKRDQCIISEDIIQGVNRDRSTWRAYNYTKFLGKKLEDGLVYYLGTLPLSVEIKRMNPIMYEKDVTYPNTFDSRTFWPNYISPVVDQKWCGSDWAVSIAGIVSDRFAIQSNGAENLLLSPQIFLSCNRRGQQGCKGGHIDVAWSFARNHGLVDDNCLPYIASASRCPFKSQDNIIQDGCRPSIPQRTSRYKVGPPSRLKREEDIMYDIMDSGPVQAIMTVYQDFFHYRDGIYRHSRYGDNQMQGLHSVRIIGWGEDRGDKFWIVANSWGHEWGENGYFRIAKGENESGIESFVVTALVEVVEAYQSK